ncbi:hypothetical protein QS257_02585 [Terrilactibacillus sp. S3-3]|nr:hypothetical protein QS257_02585 [Terrilactibacillus sp. S3-3]
MKDTGVYPISDVHAKADVQEKKETELDAIIRNIADIYQQMGLKRLKSPWLPPLPARLVRPEETKKKRQQPMFLLSDSPIIRKSSCKSLCSCRFSMRKTWRSTERPGLEKRPRSPLFCWRPPGGIHRIRCNFICSTSAAAACFLFENCTAPYRRLFSLG